MFGALRRAVRSPLAITSRTTLPPPTNPRPIRNFSNSPPRLAGHSHFANIKHKKERADAAKSHTFGKLAMAIKVASRLGGPNPKENAALAIHIDKAKAAGMKRDRIEHAIKSGQGVLGDQTSQLVFECRGPARVAMLVISETDNRQRAMLHITTAFKKSGGDGIQNPGTTIGVFEKVGTMQFNCSEKSEDEIFELLVDAGIEDFSFTDESKSIVEVKSDGNSMYKVKSALEAAGLPALAVETEYIPRRMVEFDEEGERGAFMKLLGVLENLEDVAEVIHNADLTEPEEEEE